MSDVFISYSRSDIAFARLLHGALVDNGLDTWIDWQDIPPSADWLAEIYEAIEGADTFVFIISQTSLESEVCGYEIAHATQHNKRLIPIVISEIEAGKVPKELAALNWIFFEGSGEKFNRAVANLVTAITVDQAWVKAHTRLENRALEWEKKEQEGGALLRGGDLAEAETWLAGSAGKDPQPTALQTQYILASRQDTTRRQRRNFAFVVVALTVAILLGIVAWTQRNVAVAEGNARATAQVDAVKQRNVAVAQGNARATAQFEAEAASTLAVAQRNEAERQARLARSGLFSVESLSHLEDALSLALLLSVEAFNQADTLQSRSSLLSALTHHPSAVRDFYGHQGPVSNVAFSPDGELMATAGCSLPGPSRGTLTCEQGEILLWDAGSGELLDVITTPHPVFISNLVFSPDGTTLVSSDWNGNIVVWDVDTRQSLGDPLYDQFGRVLDLVFSPDGSYFVSSHELLNTGGGNMISGELRVWDPKTLGLLKHIPMVFTLPYGSLAITPDGKKMVAAQQSAASISLWDLDTWEKIPDAFEGYDDVVRSMDISPDGSTLVIANYDGSLLLWDMASMAPRGGKLLGHTDLINKVAFSPDGSRIASVGEDQAIRLWGVSSGEALGDPFATMTESITDVAFHPTNGTFATTGQEGSVLLWSSSTHTAIEQVLVEAGEDLWSAALSPDGAILAAAGNHGVVDLWDLSHDPIPLSTLPVNSGQIYDLVFSPDGASLALGGQPGVQLWDWEAGVLLAAQLMGRELPVVCLDFSPDGELLASGGMDAIIHLWDPLSVEMAAEPLIGHRTTVNDLAFNPSGDVLASVGCVSQDPQYCEQGELILWDLSGSQVVSTTRTIHGHNVWTVAFSPDGRTLATGSGDETIQLWDVSSGDAVGGPILGHEFAVTSLAFSPDGRTLASGGLDTTILLTDLESRQRLGPPLTSPEGAISSLVFSPDGDSLVSTSQNGSLILWVLDPEVWIQRACRRAGRNLTQAEWQAYFPGEDYRRTCMEFE